MNRIINAISLRIKLLYNSIGGEEKNYIHGVSMLRRLNNFIILGDNNTIDVHSRIPKNVQISIYGSNHTLVIEEGVTFKKRADMV